MSAEALAARTAALWSDRRLRITVALLGFAALTVVTALIAHPRMFTGFHDYDDEGYMLTALKGFVNGGHLYDQVFSQYGPFYYEFWGGIFSLFGIGVTHDSGRTATMVAWVLAGLGFGLVTWRLTASVFLGWAAQVLSFNALEVLTNEPMHTYGLIALLLVAVVAASLFVGERESPYAMALLGAAVAALVLVKINVGFFAALSVALACALSYPLLWRRRWPRIGLELLFVAVPVLLMLSKLGEGWARHYAVHVAVSAAVVPLVMSVRSSNAYGQRGSGIAGLTDGLQVTTVPSPTNFTFVRWANHGVLAITTTGESAADSGVPGGLGVGAASVDEARASPWWARPTTTAATSTHSCT